MSKELCEFFVNNSKVTFIGGGTQGKVFLCILSDGYETPFTILRRGAFQKTKNIIIKIILIYNETGVNNFWREARNHSDVYLNTCKSFNPIAPALFGAYIYPRKDFKFTLLKKNEDPYPLRNDSLSVGCLFMEYPCESSLLEFLQSEEDEYYKNISISYFLIQHIRLLIECEMKHGDLNLNNALACFDKTNIPPVIDVILIDFDKTQRKHEIIDDVVIRLPPTELHIFIPVFNEFVSKPNIKSFNTMIELLQLNQFVDLFNRNDIIIRIVHTLCSELYTTYNNPSRLTLPSGFLSTIWTPPSIGFGKHKNKTIKKRPKNKKNKKTKPIRKKTNRKKR
jgi:hypothetical protein